MGNCCCESKVASTTSTGDGGPGEQYKGRIYSSSSKRPYKQDLPPKGGYAAINFKRIPAKTIVNAPILFGGFFLVQAYGMWRYSLWKQRRDRERIEERSAQLALEPLLLAERDREYLKQVRRNRDAEASDGGRGGLGGGHVLRSAQVQDSPGR